MIFNKHTINILIYWMSVLNIQRTIFMYADIYLHYKNVLSILMI